MYVCFITVPPKINIYGPSIVHVGSNVQIKCLLLEGTVSPNIYIATPRGKIIQSSNISFIATLNDTGQYSCVANISLITTAESHYLYVYGMFLYNYICMYIIIMCVLYKCRGIPETLLFKMVEKELFVQSVVCM